MLKRCFYHALELPSLQNHDPNKLLFSRSYLFVLNYFSTAKMQEKNASMQLPSLWFSAGGIGPDRAGSNWESSMNKVR